jgi:hypothetical protein
MLMPQRLAVIKDFLPRYKNVSQDAMNETKSHTAAHRKDRVTELKLKRGETSQGLRALLAMSRGIGHLSFRSRRAYPRLTRLITDRIRSLIDSSPATRLLGYATVLVQLKLKNESLSPKLCVQIFSRESMY